MRAALRAARNARGMTQQQVADALGMSLRYYQNLEAGTRKGPIEVWDALEDLLGVNQRALRFQDPEGSR